MSDFCDDAQPGIEAMDQRIRDCAQSGPMLSESQLLHMRAVVLCIECDAPISQERKKLIPHAIRCAGCETQVRKAT